MRILALNGGSSSVKVAVFRVAADGGATALVRGELERITTKPHLRATDGQGQTVLDLDVPAESYDAALGEAVTRLDGLPVVAGIGAVGHRVVHGGTRFVSPVLVDDGILAELEGLVELAPLHEPHNLAGIRAIARAHPHLPQVACFDTAFHAGMPRSEVRFALPADIEALGVRRYGFHGLSYEYVSSRLSEVFVESSCSRVVIAHLGSGASMCAVRDGHSIATTMSFSALDGLVMGTRCGELDAEVVLYLLARGWSAAQIGDALWKRSGLLGLSGLSADVRDLLASSEPAAHEALEMFAVRAARELGSLAAALGGIEALVFTAGIGEHAAPVRAAIAERSRWLGIELDSTANARHATRIDAPNSRVAVAVIPTDEEVVVAKHTRSVIASTSNP